MLTLLKTMRGGGIAYDMAVSSVGLTLGKALVVAIPESKF